MTMAGQRVEAAPLGTRQGSDAAEGRFAAAR
jgi:hypothetical protein